MVIRQHKIIGGEDVLDATRRLYPDKESFMSSRSAKLPELQSVCYTFYLFVVVNLERSLSKNSEATSKTLSCINGKVCDAA